MRRPLLTVLCIVISAAFIQAEQPVSDPGNSITAVSRIMTYQGILKDTAGEPVGDGTYNLILRLYDASEGGSLLWTSSLTQIQTTDGYFKCEFGPVDLPFNATYYLSVQVQGDSEMGPRQKLTANSYALRSDSSDVATEADLLDGQHATAFALPGHEHDSAYVNEGQANSITSGMIVDSTIAFCDIGRNGATSGQVIKWNGTGWAAAGDSAGAALWAVQDSVIRTNSPWGIMKGNADNSITGGAPWLAINFGNACTTATGFDDMEWEYFGSTVAGGLGNRAGGLNSNVAGGRHNRATGDYSSILGGRDNIATLGYGAIAGGWDNEIIGDCFIGAGEHNYAAGLSVVSGGQSNNASGIYSLVSGGRHNTASGDSSAIAGGAFNAATGSASIICGGAGHSTNGDFSTIPGGRADTITSAGDYSLIFGNHVYLSVPYRVYFFNSDFPGRIALNRDSRDGGASQPIQAGTDATNGNGAYLTAGGVWTNGSSRTFKENFTPFDGEELLRKISALSITSYNYKNSTEKHVGPVAEEFVEAFDTGVIRESDGKRDDLYLSSGDVAGVALAGVQELIEQNRQMKKMIDELRDEIIELKTKSK